MYTCVGLHQPHDKGLCIGEKMEGDVNKNRKCLHLSEKKGLRNSWISRNSSNYVSNDIFFNPVHTYMSAIKAHVYQLYQHQEGNRL